jgi:DNA (cytosine-5)-methyltransferase 1
VSRPLVCADLFCGAGGTSTGLALAARHLERKVELLAVNHWPVAVETHAANHPDARHLCATLDGLDPRKAIPGGKLDLLVASPECTHHSTARGGKPMSDQSRASAFHVLHWAEQLQPTEILVENVPEFQTWGPLGSNGRPLKSRAGETFRAWRAALVSLGYTVEARVLCAADYGDPTTRRRLFVRARRGRGLVRWPTPTHADPEREPLMVASGQRQVWRTAREIIEWARRGRSIFGRPKPLAEKTLARIEEGLRRFGGEAAEPFLVLLTHGGRARSLDRPLPTITAANRGEMAVVEFFLLGQQSGGAPRAVSAPVPAVATRGAISLVQPFLVPGYGERPGQPPRTHSVDAPVPTIPASSKFGLAQPYLVSFYGNGQPHSVARPMPTTTTKDRFGLVEPQQQLDILFRMLEPGELARAMGFPDDYRFKGTRSDVVRQVGNAVAVNTAAALCRAALEAA